MQKVMTFFLFYFPHTCMTRDVALKSKNMNYLKMLSGLLRPMAEETAPSLMRTFTIYTAHTGANMIWVH
jgi:hypothetical protein